MTISTADPIGKHRTGTTTEAPKYQLFDALRLEELRALEADIAKRGVLVPIDVDQDGNILDGHHRVEIADKLGKSYKRITRRFKTETDKREHVIKLNLCRRHLDPIRWGLIFRMLLQERGVSERPGPGDSATVALIAEEVGVPRRTAFRRIAAARSYEALPQTEREAIDSGEITLKQAKRQAEDGRREQRKREALAEPVTGDYGVITGSYELLFERLENESVDVVYTDPPYAREYIDLYGGVARLGAEKLKPGGSALVYLGDADTIRQLNALAEHLTFRAILVVHYGGQHQSLFPQCIWNQRRLVALFVKAPVPKPETQRWVLDVQTSLKPQKDLHRWQQDQGPIAYWLERLCPPGGTVVDPFAGSGTTLVAAAQLRLCWVGTEIDPGTAAVARKRIREAMKTKGVA